MLVTFTSSTSGEIMMFAPIARQLLEIIGKECSARGVITTEQLPEAIHRLRQAVREAAAPPAAEAAASSPADDEDAGEGQHVGLAQRAHPLIELLEWTREREGFILWQAAKDF